MYALFSMIFVFFLSPFNWAVILLLITLFSKKPKWKKRSLIYAVLILVIFSNTFLLSLYARLWDVEPVPLEKGKVYSAAIILGGFTGEDKNGNGFFNGHSDRLIAGMRLMATGQVSHILISGGNNDIFADQFTEAAWVKKTLKDFNFPDSVILSEQRSRNTAENALDSKQLLDKAHLPPPYLLVTSAFHMRRAMYLFEKKGMEVIPYPCDYIAGNTKLSLSDYIVPNFNVMGNWVLYIKELFGLALAHFKG